MVDKIPPTKTFLPLYSPQAKDPPPPGRRIFWASGPQFEQTLLWIKYQDIMGLVVLEKKGFTVQAYNHYVTSSTSYHSENQFQLI